MIETRASEAKYPFPGGKRAGSWGKKKRNGWNNSKREEGWELGEEKESKRKSNRKTKEQRLDHVIGGKYSESFWLNINNLPCSDIKLFEFRKVNFNKYARCGIQILKMNPNYWACRINVKHLGR